METKRIAPGFYKFEYKGFKVNVINRAGDMPGVDGWYYTYINVLGDFNPAEDIYRTKGIAIDAAIEFIDFVVDGIYQRNILR